MGTGLITTHMTNIVDKLPVLLQVELESVVQRSICQVRELLDVFGPLEMFGLLPAAIRKAVPPASAARRRDILNPGSDICLCFLDPQWFFRYSGPPMFGAVYLTSRIRT